MISWRIEFSSKCINKYFRFTNILKLFLPRSKTDARSHKHKTSYFLFLVTQTIKILTIRPSMQLLQHISCMSG